MNFYWIIGTASFSALYFESKLISIGWLRIIIYILIMIVICLWAYRQEQGFLTLWQKLVNTIQNGGHQSDLPSKGYSRLLKYIMQPMKNFEQKLRKNNFGVQVAAGQISASTQQLTFTLSESHTFARQLSEEAQDIVQVNDSSQKSLTKAITTLKELVTALESVDNISHQVRITGSESKKNINVGLTQIMEILSGVRQVEDSTLEAVASINQFQETFRAISGILGAVDDIANQTQLLALNASIEAARAGDQGVGFGVVAREIRTLADNSKQAVSQISMLVLKMTGDVKNITETMGRNRGFVQNCVDLSKRVETGLTQISASHEKVQELLQAILLGTRKQYEYAIDIGQQVDVVEESFQEVNNRFSDISSAIATQNMNLENIEILAQNLLDAERGLSGLIASEHNLIDENQQALLRTAELAIQIMMKKSNDFEFNSPPQCKALLDGVLKDNDFMEAVWLNDQDGKFVYSNPPAQIANANVREWFKRAMNGERYVSSVYISAITNAPCLTVSLPIKDAVGTTTGIIGADIKVAV
ncbi:methyl-accepting chemotaxis protein [Desulfosporosinus sp. OT]|uniref:methyl-accepting chemotaxis protein n=1 Tax=Desulfosporosinus sp. OT TaxID=913865 RepID=UPI000223AD9B|nr:methyl-accepting chemotaxis protein [Desulfosporosinus sp. OT]EGW38960.1 methyl-accepting chemotaxis (MCP) signaling domain protein [Desulfosporosinus sp. OT]